MRACAARAGVEVTLRAAADAWAEGAAAVAERLAQLRGLMRKYSGPADPAAELLALLACGRLSNALHQFLSANLGAPPPPGGRARRPGGCMGDAAVGRREPTPARRAKGACVPCLARRFAGARASLPGRAGRQG